MKRFDVLERDGFECVYCGVQAYDGDVDMAVDHVMPVSLGGKNHADNMATACQLCNGGKGSRTLGDVEAVLAIVRERNDEHGIDGGERYYPPRNQPTKTELDERQKQKARNRRLIASLTRYRDEGIAPDTRGENWQTL